MNDSPYFVLGLCPVILFGIPTGSSNMEVSLINMGLAFFEGIALIISPCILPILPIILSGSLEGKKSRPYGIILGFVLAFTLFTYFSRELVRLSGIDLNIIRNLSLGLLVLIAVIMLSDFLTEKFEWLAQSIAKRGSSTQDYSKSEFINGLIFGGLIGLVWTPCAGPILAAVIVQTVSSIKIHFRGKKVYAVMGIASAFPVKVRLLLNGELVIADKAADVIDSSVNVTKHDLYRLVELKQASEGILELTAITPGLEVYTFTFG